MLQPGGLENRDKTLKYIYIPYNTHLTYIHFETGEIITKVREENIPNCWERLKNKNIKAFGSACLCLRLINTPKIAKLNRHAPERSIVLLVSTKSLTSKENYTTSNEIIPYANLSTLF